VRIGLLTAQGGKEHLKRIRSLCRPALPWDNKRWKEEMAMYLKHWNRYHGLPLQRSIQKKIRIFTPLVVAGKWIKTIAIKILPRRLRGNSS